jgi:hypothetical protein
VGSNSTSTSSCCGGQHRLAAVPGDQAGYVEECLELAVVTQGRTLDETVKNLQEASFGLRERPTVVLTMELDSQHTQAS